jgi:hypothetical protein
MMVALPHHMRDCFCNLFLKVLEWQQKGVEGPAMRDIAAWFKIVLADCPSTLVWR